MAEPSRKNAKSLSPHPLADLIPMMSEEEYAALKADIKAHGLHEPVTLYEGLILDGRNRSRACSELGIEPAYRVYEGSEPARFVISMNVHRRHLDTTQRALIAKAALPHFEAEARRRQGHRTDLEHGGTNATMLSARKRLARDEAAAVVSVSGKTVADLIRIERKAPELYDEVVTRKKSISSAARELRSQSAPRVKLENGRSVLLAKKAYERLINILGGLDGLAESIRILRIDLAMAVAPGDEVDQHIATTMRAETAIRRLRSELERRKKP